VHHKIQLWGVLHAHQVVDLGTFGESVLGDRLRLPHCDGIEQLEIRFREATTLLGINAVGLRLPGWRLACRI
jgi:hypothetical protein